MTARRSALAPLLLLLATAVARADGPPPDLIALPPGFGPEGIAAGLDRLYVGALRTGAILTVNPRSGAAETLVPAVDGRFALGLAWDRRSNALFVAGGPSGHVYVYDGSTGALRADYAVATGFSLINGLALTRDAVYATDSVNPVLYQLPLGPGGALPAPGQVRSLGLAGDFPVIPRAFNANGVVATPDGKDLIIVHTAAGKLFHVDAATGLTSAVDLGTGSVPNGDGLWLRGHTLYVMQNLNNQIAVVELAPDLRSGTIVRAITDPRFDVITSAAAVGDALYLTNARYTTRPTPETIYSIVRLALCGR